MSRRTARIVLTLIGIVLTCAAAYVGALLPILVFVGIVAVGMGIIVGFVILIEAATRDPE